MPRLGLIVSEDALRRLEQEAKARRTSPARVAEEAVENYAWDIGKRSQRFKEAERLVDDKLKQGMT